MSLIIIDTSETDDCSIVALKEFLQEWHINTVDERNFARDCNRSVEFQRASGREINTWYWIYHPQEGDIFYPVFVNSDGGYLMDGKLANPEGTKDLNSLNWTKSTMPEHV